MCCNCCSSLEAMIPGEGVSRYGEGSRRCRNKRFQYSEPIILGESNSNGKSGEEMIPAEKGLRRRQLENHGVDGQALPNQ